MSGIVLSSYGASLGLTLLLAVATVVAIGLAVQWASRHCETNAEAARRARRGEPVCANMPRARALRAPYRR